MSLSLRAIARVRSDQRTGASAGSVQYIRHTQFRPSDLIMGSVGNREVLRPAPPPPPPLPYRLLLSRLPQNKWSAFRSPPAPRFADVRSRCRRLASFTPTPVTAEEKRGRSHDSCSRCREFNGIRTIKREPLADVAVPAPTMRETCESRSRLPL